MKGMTLRNAASLCAQEFTVEYADGSKETIFVRTPGEVEISAANAEIAEERVKFHDDYKPGTTLYKSFAMSLEYMSDSELAQMVMSTEILDMRQRAELETPSPMTPDWSRYKTDKELETAEEAHKCRVADYQREVQNKFQARASVRLDELTKLSHEELIERAIRPALKNLLEQKTRELTDNHFYFLAVRCGDDHGKTYFDDPSEIATLPEPIKDLLDRAVSALGEIQVADIKNSQGKSVGPTGLAASTPEATTAHSTTDSQASDSPKTRSRGGRKPSSTD